jgi:putative transcriptional regulator
LIDFLIAVQSRPHITVPNYGTGFFPALPMSTASLNNNIRRLRFDRGMTQEELALRVGVSRQTIMSIERGATNPSVLLAFKVSMALQAPVTEVFQVEGGLVPV